MNVASFCNDKANFQDSVCPSTAHPKPAIAPSRYTIDSGETCPCSWVKLPPKCEQTYMISEPIIALAARVLYREG